jgi:cytochrome c biogenesis protein CcmG/thiol:disulfide interchange protein DsbE
MAMRARHVKVIGVAYKDAPPNTQALLTRLGDPYQQTLVDRDGRAGIEFGVTGVPETYLVGQDGKVLAKHTGPLSEADAQALGTRALTGR